MLGEAGRNVRCGSCGHSWHQTPTTEDPEIESGSKLEPEQAPLVKPETPAKPDRTLDKLDEQRKRVGAAIQSIPSQRFSTFKVVGWIALLAFVGGLIAVIVAGRETIIAQAPGASRFYEMVGLQAVVGQGLELRDVISERRVVAGEDTLVIEGTIVNVSQSPQPVPRLRASLVDSDGVELASWAVSAHSTSLPPGGFTTFQANAVNPPAVGQLGLAFISAQE